MAVKLPAARRGDKVSARWLCQGDSAPVVAAGYAAAKRSL
jgi:hypothetical protein